MEVSNDEGDRFWFRKHTFINFLVPSFSISARINVEHLWKFSKENNRSFFVLSLGPLMNGLNDIPEMKRKIIDNKVFEFKSLDAFCPIMKKGDKVYKEMRVKPPQKFDNIFKWYDYVVDH